MSSPEDEKKMWDLTETGDKRSGEMTSRTNEQTVNNYIDSVTSDRCCYKKCDFYNGYSLNDFGAQGRWRFRSMIRTLNIVDHISTHVREHDRTTIERFPRYLKHTFSLRSFARYNWT